MSKKLTKRQQSVMDIFARYDDCKILTIPNHERKTVFYVAHVFHDGKEDYLDLPTRTVKSLHKRGLLRYDGAVLVRAEESADAGELGALGEGE